MGEFIFICFGIPGYIVVIIFLIYLFTGQLPEESVNRLLLGFCEIWCLLVLPGFYVVIASEYNCCHDEIETSLFAPGHSISIYVLIALCLSAYFYSNCRMEIATPVLEIITNCLLLTGVILNIVIAIQIQAAWLILEGSMPIIILFILTLAKNQNAFKNYIETMDFTPAGRYQSIAWYILQLKPVFKFPVLFILCLPLLVILSAILMVAGQKPDSFIRAFTDVYNRGFSQGEFNCEGINQPCEGHYLCTIAAKGHRSIVKPQRLGIRHGQIIICNRQLLISNAFEDVLQEKIPRVHRFIRNKYDKVGTFTHRHYNVFNHKLVSDSVYILMKPLEWTFWLTLYTVDKKPENRIAKQYLTKKDRIVIDNIESQKANSTGSFIII